MSVLVNFLCSSPFLPTFFLLVVLIILLCAITINCILHKNHWYSNKDSIAKIIFLIIISSACVTVFWISYNGYINKTIYGSVEQLEACPFEYLKDGALNLKQIKISENILYPEDKLVSFNESSGFKFEVENHEGHSKVVAVFENDKEIDNVGKLFVFLCLLFFIPFPYHNKYSIAKFILLMIFAFACFTFSCILDKGYQNEIIYESTAQLEACPFEYLKDGAINCNQINTSKNILYPEDKVVSFKESIYKFEVENHAGHSKVVAVFRYDKEIDFP